MHSHSPMMAEPSIHEKLHEWLNLWGVETNPFDSQYLDAGADPQLSFYLVGHQSFAATWKDQASVVFAPVGGGKSAFRVRLAHACRVEQDGRRIFPIVYKLPDPTHFEPPASILEQHYHFINQKIAYECLLQLLYHPERWEALAESDRQLVAANLYKTLSTDPLSLLEQLTDVGDLAPLFALYDPTALRLPGLPNREVVRLLCRQLTEQMATALTSERSSAISAQEQFQLFKSLLQGAFHYSALYLLVDGIDAYLETTEQQRRATELFEPLLRETSLLDAHIYPKFFIPTDLRSAVMSPRLLPFGGIVDVSFIDIHWTTISLSEMLAARLRVASRGMFDNLDALCSPGLRGVHTILADAAPNSPREVLSLAERLLLEHIWRVGPVGRLELVDLERALVWRQEQRRGA